MTTVGRWSPNKVRARVLDGTWVAATSELGGMVLLTPTSIAYTGTSASIGTNGSVEFTACSSLSLNGVFSADYDNYRMVMWYSASSNNTTVQGRLRDSVPADATAANYTFQYLLASSTSVSGYRGTSQTLFELGGGFATQRNGIEIDIYGPHLAQPTALRTVTVNDSNSAQLYDFADTHSLSTSYVGFTFLTNNALSGLVSVYGLVGA